MKVLYFAQAAEAAGCREEDWETPEPLSLHAFWTEAARRHPNLAALESSCRIASGGEYVAGEQMLNPDRETAVIPPVSGG
jgi:molybdopterin converting factor small subunit